MDRDHLNGLQVAAQRKAQLTAVTPTALEMALENAKQRIPFTSSTPRPKAAKQAKKCVPEKQATAEKVTPPHKGKATKEHAANRPSIEKGTVMLPRGKEFLLIMEFLAEDILDGVQVVRVTPPARSPQKHEVQLPCFRNAKFDLESLLGRVSVKGMNITKCGSYHLLYIRCEEAGKHKGELGFDTWKDGPYSQMVEKLMKHTWGAAVFRNTANNQASLVLKKYDARSAASTKVFFTIEPVVTK